MAGWIGENRVLLNKIDDMSHICYDKKTEFCRVVYKQRKGCI